MIVDEKDEGQMERLWGTSTGLCNDAGGDSPPFLMSWNDARRHYLAYPRT
jgi:hypothetical protein